MFTAAAIKNILTQNWTILSHADQLELHEFLVQILAEQCAAATQKRDDPTAPVTVHSPGVESLITVIAFFYHTYFFSLSLESNLIKFIQDLIRKTNPHIGLRLMGETIE